MTTTEGMEMNDIFDQIKRRISCKEVLRNFGLEYNSHNIKCPFHDDSNPSFSVTPDGNHFECFGCGKKGDCIELYELLSGKSKADAVSAMKQMAGIYDEPKKEIVAVYDYKFPDGSPNYQVVRYRPKSFAQRKSEYDWTIKGCPRTPFRLEKWYSNDEAVLVVEGEKDVLSLEALGFSATCNSSGAGKWTDEHSGYLKGRVCHIFPDNDDPGRDHASKVAISLHVAAKEARIVEITRHCPELPDKGDISDFINIRRKQGRSDTEIAEEVKKMMEVSPLITDSDIAKIKTGFLPKHATFADTVKSGEVEEILKGTMLEPVLKYLGSPASPPLPIEITLPKALSLFGCATTSKADAPPEGAYGIRCARLIINTGGGQAANVWTLVVGESGTGKDIGMGEYRLAKEMGWDVGGSGSAEGIADALIEKPNGLLRISELENWLNKSHWQFGAQSFLVTAFNCGYFKTCLSKKSGGSCRRESGYCYPNIAANIQPDILASVASEHSVDNGFINRFLISLVQDPKAWEPSTADNSTLFNDAKIALECAGKKKGIVLVPEGYLRSIRREFSEKHLPFRGHWGRLVNEYGPRFALFLAMKNDGDPRIVIEDEHWRKAEVLIRWFYGMAHLCLDQISTDPFTAKKEKRLKKFATYVFRHGSATLTHLARDCGKGTDSKMREGIMDELVHRGVVVKDGNRFIPGTMPFEWV